MRRYQRNKITRGVFVYKKYRWLLIAAAAIALFFFIFKTFFLPQEAIVHQQLTPTERDIVQREKLVQIIQQILQKYGIQPEWMTQTIEKKTIRVPPQISIIQLCQEIANESAGIGAEILKSHENLKNETVILELGLKQKLLQRLKFIKDRSLTLKAGRIAIIIDDFGYSISNTAEDFLHLEIPFAVAIIPGLKYSTKIAELALLNQKEILIHFPMEPLSEQVDESEYLITTTQTAEEIRHRVQLAAELLPAAVGLNNHQGSKAMADLRLVKSLMQEIDAQKLFFVDSRTTAATVGYKTAKEMHIPAAERDVFLDTQEDRDSIHKQLLKLARKSRQKAYAIGIGHVKQNTLEILKKDIVELKRLGYEFVLVSEVVN